MREQRAIIEETDARFATFVRDEINPGAVERDRTNAPFTREQVRRAGALGLLGYSVPRASGGEGRDFFEWGTTLTRLGELSVDASFPLVFSLYSAVVNKIAESDSEYVRDRYLAKMLRGEILGANAFSDNADAFAFKTRTREQDDGSIVVSGVKPWVTAGAMADVFITYAGNDRGDLSVLLVDRDDPGVSVAPLQMMGMRAAGLAEITLKDVRVPKERVLARHDGLSHGQRFLNERRLILVCGALGATDRMVRECAAFLQRTIRYDRPLAEMQHVQAVVGRMAILLETAKTMSAVALERLAEGKHDRHWDAGISSAKYVVSDACIEIARAVLQVTGGAGYSARDGFERVVRDHLALIAGAGSQDTLQVDLGIHYLHQRGHK